MTEVDEKIPTVSIGLPVFNGANYLEAAIGSILAQTFPDFELIISDNASTDATEAIGRRYAAADPRVRYHRNETNIGGARNQKQTVDMSRGRYFRLAAHDDLIAPTFLEECVAVLEKDPDVVICYPGTVVIDADGNDVSEYQSERGTASRPSKRFAELAFRTHNCDAVYGVMRGSVVRSTPPMGNFIDADKVFLCNLAMWGPFQAIHRPLFYKRFHAEELCGQLAGPDGLVQPRSQGQGVVPELVGAAGVRAGGHLGPHQPPGAPRLRGHDGGLGGVVLPQAGQGPARGGPDHVVPGSQATGAGRLQLGVRASADRRERGPSGPAPKAPRAGDAAPCVGPGPGLWPDALRARRPGLRSVGPQRR